MTMRYAIRFLALLSLGSFFVTACITDWPQQGGGLSLPSRDNDYYERSNRRDSNRRSALERSRSRYSGTSCERSRQCEDLCQDIYSRRSVKEDCLVLAEDQVEEIWEIYKILKNPKEDDLEDIDPEDFEIFVEIDLQPLDTLIGDFSNAETKKVLTWMIRDPDIIEIFQDEDDEYNLLEELLESLDGESGSSQYQSALSKNIDGSDSFMDLAIDNDGPALDWIHSFFENQCSSSSSLEEICIFESWYCEVGLNKDRWKSLVDYEDFEEIINEILDSHRPASPPDWWTEEVDADDLTITSGTNRLRDLCDMDLS